MTRQNLGFALGCVLGRRALSLIFRSVEWLLINLQTIKVVGYVRRGSLDSHRSMHFPYEIASERDGLGGRNPWHGKILGLHWSTFWAEGPFVKESPIRVARKWSANPWGCPANPRGCPANPWGRPVNPWVCPANP